MARIYFLFLLSASALFSCASETDSITDSRWINIDSLINAQITLGVRIEKSTTLNNVNSDGEVTKPKNWNSELEAFARIAVMNKPIYRNQFSITFGADPNSNLQLKKIMATDSSAPVRKLQISILPQSHQIIRLEAFLKENSLFYSKQERLIMEFDPHTGRLERYSVNGWQKMAWFRPDQYGIRASVSYP